MLRRVTRDLDREEVRVVGAGRGGRVLGMGFAKTLNSIIAMLPKQKDWVVFGDADGGVGGVA